MRELCHRHGYAACLALALFVTSSVFVQGFAKLAVLEYGAESAGVAAACRWDCNWYRRIIDDGYNLEPYHNLKSHPKNDAANWPFFPAHPIFAELLSVISGADTKLSLVLTSKFFMLVAIFVFITFAGEVVGPDARRLAGVVLAFNPYLIYAHAGYTEPLYFLLTTMAFRALRRDSWVSAGVFGGILSATRLVGSPFAVSYAVAVGIVGLVTLRRSWPTYLLGLLICPLGLALFMVYLYFLVGDALAFMHIQVASILDVSEPSRCACGRPSIRRVGTILRAYCNCGDADDSMVGKARTVCLFNFFVRCGARAAIHRSGSYA